MFSQRQIRYVLILKCVTEHPFFCTLRRYQTVLKGSIVKLIDQVSKLLYTSGIRVHFLLFEVTTRDGSDALDTISREELCNAIAELYSLL